MKFNPRTFFSNRRSVGWSFSSRTPAWTPRDEKESAPRQRCGKTRTPPQQQRQQQQQQQLRRRRRKQLRRRAQLPPKTERREKEPQLPSLRETARRGCRLPGKSLSTEASARLLHARVSPPLSRALPLHHCQTVPRSALGQDRGRGPGVAAGLARRTR